MEHGYALATTLNQKKTKAAIFLLLKNICLQGLLSVATTTALASGETGEKRQDKRERLRAVNSGDVKCARVEKIERREREAWGGERRGEEGRGGETRERGGGGKGKGGSHLRRNAGGKRQRGKRKLIS